MARASYTYDSNSQLVLLLAMHCLHNESIRAWEMFCSRLCYIYNFEWTDHESEDEGEGEGGGGGEDDTQVHPHRIDSDEKVMIADGHAAIAAMFAGEHAVFEDLHRALCMDHRKDHAGTRGGSAGNYRTYAAQLRLTRFGVLSTNQSPSSRTLWMRRTLTRSFDLS